MMTDSNFTFSIKRIAFDENYCPDLRTRITTNFANLARGESRQENLRNALRMIDNRFNSLARWDNPKGGRYSVEVEIVSAEMHISANGKDEAFPIIEMLQATIVDKHSNARIEGMFGNSLSSYVRDYDFSIRLPNHKKHNPIADAPDDFGDLHGQLFQHFLRSNVYRENFAKPPVICLSVSSSRSYLRTTNEHPVLGVEYLNDDYSLTDAYFAKMGMKVRYFMPPNSVAPFAFYHFGDLLCDYSGLELASSISVMETFQKIYRPEIYNANSAASEQYRPSLHYQDYSLTRIVYDRQERSSLAFEQAKFAEEHLIKPYQILLTRWFANSVL